jgi:hypothetical protein
MYNNNWETNKPRPAMAAIAVRESQQIPTGLLLSLLCSTLVLKAEPLHVSSSASSHHSDGVPSGGLHFVCLKA